MLKREKWLLQVLYLFYARPDRAEASSSDFPKSQYSTAIQPHHSGLYNASNMNHMDGRILKPIDAVDCREPSESASLGPFVTAQHGLFSYQAGAVDF